MRDVTIKQWIFSVVIWSVFMLLLGVFTRQPSVSLLADDQAVIKVVIRYSGKRLGECRQLNSAELESLPPNMRQATVCPREKSPLYARLEINDKQVYEETLIPSGIHNDGVLAGFDQIKTRVGPVNVRFVIRDSLAATEPTHQIEQTILLDRNRIVTFHFTDKGFRVTGV